VADHLLLGTLSATGSAQAVLLTLIASIVLLSLRAWSRSSRALLTRMISTLLDVAIAVFVIAFIGLVVLRFKSLA
jgi:hypothetical protein